MSATRPFTTSVLALLTALAACSSPSGEEASSPISEQSSALSTTRPPNIVFFLLDDLDDGATRRYLPEVMPTFTALEREGVRFTQSFVPTAICCASRSSTLSGKCGHNTNVLTNGGPQGGWAQFKDEDGTAPGSTPSTINAALAGAGYRTGLFGKYLNGYETAADGTLPPVPPGWTDWHVFVDPGLASYTGYGYDILAASPGKAPALESYGFLPRDYSTDVLRDKATAFLRDAAAAGKPSFLFFSGTAPHVPLKAAPRHKAIASKWSCASLPGLDERPNFFADGASFDDKPLWLRASKDKRGSDTMKAYNCKDWEDRLGSLYAADEALAALVSTLKATGEWQRTLLVVTSDNGYNLGAHTLVHKMAPYEESIRVPLFIAGGASLGLRGGTEVRAALNVDLAPTFREAAGLAPAPDADGRSLLPLARGALPSTPWRTRIPLEYAGGAAGNGIGSELPKSFLYVTGPAIALDIPPYRGVRTTPTTASEHAYKMVEWYADPEHPSAHEYEIYDVTEDPFELANLVVTQPARAAALASVLLPKLEEVSSCKGAACSSR